MTRRGAPWIYCVEAEWSASLRNEKTVEPLLDCVQALGKVKYIHNRARSLDAFLDLTARWPQEQYSRYGLGVFAAHGSEGTLHFGRRRIELEDLAEHLAGRLAGKVVHFASCSVLNVHKRRIDEFRRVTKARAVSGYRTDVDWFPSSALELLLFEAFTGKRNIDAVDRFLNESARELRRKLRYRLEYGRL